MWGLSFVQLNSGHMDPSHRHTHDLKSASHIYESLQYSIPPLCFCQAATLAAELALVEPYARHWRRIVIQRRRSRIGLPLGLTLPPLRMTVVPRATPAPAPSTAPPPKRLNSLIQSSPSLTGEPLMQSLQSSSAAPAIIQSGIWQWPQPGGGVVMAAAENGSAKSQKISHSPVSIMLGSTSSGISSSVTEHRHAEPIRSGSGPSSLEFSRDRPSLFRQSHSSETCHIKQNQPSTSVLSTVHENQIKETVIPDALKQPSEAVLHGGMMNVWGALPGGSKAESSPVQFPNSATMQSGVTRRQRPTPRRPSFI